MAGKKRYSGIMYSPNSKVKRNKRFGVLAVIISLAVSFLFAFQLYTSNASSFTRFDAYGAPERGLRRQQGHQQDYQGGQFGPVLDSPSAHDSHIQYGNAQSESGGKKHDILCFAVVHMEDRVWDNMSKNFVAMKDVCDWLLIDYKMESEVWRRKVDSDPALADVKFRSIENYSYVRNGLPTDEYDPNSDLPRVKVLNWKRLAEFATEYNAFWVLDEDISFVDFDLDGYLSAFACGLPSGPPLIMQPSVKANTQYHEIVNHNYWTDDDGHELSLDKKPLVYEANFVEIQTFLVNSKYMDWIVRNVMMLQAHEYTGSSWSIDFVWCGAGKDFSRLMGWEDRVSPGCAISGRHAFDHLNFKTMKKVGDFYNKGHTMTDLYSAAYPYWIVSKKQMRPGKISHSLKSNCEWRSAMAEYGQW